MSRIGHIRPIHVIRGWGWGEAKISEGGEGGGGQKSGKTIFFPYKIKKFAEKRKILAEGGGGQNLDLEGRGEGVKIKDGLTYMIRPKGAEFGGYHFKPPGSSRNEFSYSTASI